MGVWTRIRTAWDREPALHRRAQTLAVISAASLLAFGFLSASGILVLPGLYSVLVQAVLAAGLIVPAVRLHFNRERQEAELFSMFANIRPPEERSVTFPVPILPAYRRIRALPTRLGTILLAVAFGVAVGGSFGADALIEWQVPLSVFLLALIVPAVAVAVLALGFIGSTLRELALRKKFHAEVVAGVAEAGYIVSGPFSAEDVTECEVLLREADSAIYSSWRLIFRCSEAEMVWDESKYDPSTSHWTEMAHRAGVAKPDDAATTLAGLDPAV